MILIVRRLIYSMMVEIQHMPKYSSSEKDYLKKIGKNIRSLRQRARLSQEGLAELSELDRTYIGSVERGERNVSIINIRKIAKALKIEIREVFA